MVISTFTIVYCPTHIYKKGWLTIRLSLLIILNLVSEPSAVKNSFLPLDSPPAAAIAISPSTGAATSPASHPPAAGQEQLPHVDHVFDSSSHDFAVPLPLMGTHTSTMVPLSNTHQIVSLKLTNTNYLYWRM